MVLKETNFKFPNQTGFYKGKVRDVYFFGDKMAVVATDRISAFDHILHEAIPDKGMILNNLAAHFLTATKDIIPNWLISVPDPNVSYGYVCEPIRIEMVVRGYLTGHAWRTYHSGKRELCGVQLPEGLLENQQLPENIITPSTKAVEGHDEDISKEQILSRKLVSPEIYEQMESISHQLFNRGQQMALEKGLILVDTKYEFGLHQGKLMLIDEIHTADSSRYFFSEDYLLKLSKNEKPTQLSKEFVREWLIENNFQGKEGQTLPHLPKAFIHEITTKYHQLYSILTGNQFPTTNKTNILERIKNSLYSLQNPAH